MKKMFLGLLVGLLLALIGCTTTEVKHTVSFDTQGGTTIAALEIISGLTLSEPSSPTKEGFEFKGWKVNLEDETFFDFTTPITDDLTLIAVYDALEITITVKDSYGETFDELTVLAGSKLIDSLEMPELEGEVFAGWFADDKLTSKLDNDYVFTFDLTIFAGIYLTTTRAVAEAEGLAAGETSEIEYFVTGKVTSIVNGMFGNLYITDGDTEFYVYGVWSLDGETRFDALEEKPSIGDIVYLKGKLNNYNGNLELNQAKLISFETTTDEFDINEYSEVTIDDARNLAEGSKVLIEGVVALVTYGQGMVSNGIYVVDETNSIYVFGSDIAAAVSVGNTVTIAGIRANYVLETEQFYAELHGYQGALQLSNARLIEKENTQTAFDTSWIEEKTIRDIMQTDFQTENLTTTIFKTKAYIHKVPGTGFVNYYFYDLDDATGSYVYTQNNGSDFSWLDPYDGDLREVYLSVINAKANPSGILYRLVPILIGDEISFEASYSAEFIAKYFIEDQFLAEYVEGFDASFEVFTTYSFALYQIEEAVISYESSNEAVASFTLDNDTLIFTTGEVGQTTITITVDYNGFNYEHAIEIEVVDSETVDTLTIEQAIELEDGTNVFIEGIVGPSLANQPGFYLIDETGFVAVRMTLTELESLEMGNKVIIYGVRRHSGTKPETGGPITSIGQTVIDQAQVIVNMLGSHEYSTEHFKEGYTLSDLTGLSLLNDYSTTGYLIEVTIIYVETQYYTRYELTDGNATLRVYSGSGSQLAFLQPFVNQTVMIEFSLVNWNGNDWVGSVLAVYTEEGKVMNPYHFN